MFTIMSRGRYPWHVHKRRFKYDDMPVCIDIEISKKDFISDHN